MKPYKFTDSDGESSYAVVWRKPHKFLGRVVQLRPGAWMTTDAPHRSWTEWPTRGQAAESLVLMSGLSEPETR